MAAISCCIALLFLCIGINEISADPETESLELELEDRNLANEGVEDAILYAYMIDDDSPNYLGKGNKIFKVEKKDDISISSNANVNSEYVYSDSENTASKNIAAEMSVSGHYGAFAASASMKVSSSKNSNVKTVRVDAIVKAVKYEVASKGEFRTFPERFLTDDFKECIKTLTNEELERDVGIFYATKIKLGGEVKKSYTMEATQSDSESGIFAELSASYNGLLMGASAKASASTTNRKSNSNQKMKTRWIAQGGDTTVWLAKSFAATGANSVDNISKKWAATFTDHNLYPSDYELIPIWVLMKYVDAKKGASYQKYLEAKWEKSVEDLKPTHFLNDEKHKEGIIPTAYFTASSYDKASSNTGRKKFKDDIMSLQRKLYSTECDDSFEFYAITFKEPCYVTKVKLVNGNFKHKEYIDQGKVYVRNGNKEKSCGTIDVKKGYSAQEFTVSCTPKIYGVGVAFYNMIKKCTSLFKLEAYGICGIK